MTTKTTTIISINSIKKPLTLYIRITDFNKQYYLILILIFFLTGKIGVTIINIHSHDLLIRKFYPYIIKINTINYFV